MMELNRQTATLAALTEHLKRHHLRELAQENLRLATEMDAPLMRLFSHLPPDELLELSIQGLSKFLDDLGAGQALEAYQEQLRLWEADQLPGLSRDVVQPPDLVLLYAAQKQAILHLMPTFTQDADTIVQLVLALEDYYVKAQNAALQVFDRLRAEAVAKSVQMDAERQAAVRMADELRASEARFRELADAMPQLVWVTRGDGTFEYFNGQWARFTGSQPEGAQPVQWGQVLHPHDVERAAAAWTRSLEQGVPFEVEYRFRRHDGEYRWFMARALPVRGDDGAIARWYGTATDIHEQKLIETTLLDTKEELEMQSEELRAANEEQASQAEELASQAEELNALYDELRKHTDQVEALVAERTQELQAANEELAAQSEELLFQSEELMRINDEIERARTLLNGVMDNLPGAVGYCDRNWMIRLVNAPYAAQLGMTPDQLIGRRADEVFAEHFHLIEGQLIKVRDTGEPWRAYGQPTGAVDANGRELFQDFVVVPVRDRFGQVEGLLSLSFDASERVALEREVARRNDEVLEQKTLVESVVAHAPAGVAFLDRDLTVRWANPEFLRLTEKGADYFIGRSFLERATGEVRDGLALALRGVIDEGRTFRASAFPYTLQEEGSLKQTYWDFSYVPVRGKGGEVEGVLVFALEVSSRVENETLQQDRIEQLQQQDRYKDEFISVISHELRTPLNFIMGFASLLEDEVPGPLTEGQRQHVSKILHGADRMLLLVDDLLDFARIQAGSFSLAPELTAFDMLVEDTVGTVRPLAEQKGLVLETKVQPGIQATLDVQRVTQVLTNLLSNAIKFTDRGGAVTVRAYTEGGWVVAEVADTGVGIAPQDVPKLFQRFRQLDMSATRKVGGTGLGLSITKALVEAHGGTVGVVSRPGEGSTFAFRLPIGQL